MCQLRKWPGPYICIWKQQQPYWNRTGFAIFSKKNQEAQRGELNTGDHILVITPNSAGTGTQQVAQEIHVSFRISVLIPLFIVKRSFPTAKSTSFFSFFVILFALMEPHHTKVWFFYILINIMLVAVGFEPGTLCWLAVTLTTGLTKYVNSKFKKKVFISNLRRVNKALPFILLIPSKHKKYTQV